MTIVNGNNASVGCNDKIDFVVLLEAEEIWSHGSTSRSKGEGQRVVKWILCIVMTDVSN